MPAAPPLTGLVMIEMGTSVAAPIGAQILAEMGVEVIKVENPRGGDDARSWGPPFVDGMAPTFYAINRNKRSITVDFKDPAQCAALRRLIIERADIVLQNLRPGVVESYGLDAETLRAEKPSLIYCNLSAFGSAGPLKSKPGYDPLLQAFGGIMSVTGEEGGAPVRVGPSIVDQGAGMWAVIGILGALHRRTSTGEGCIVATSLYETALGWMTMHTAGYLASNRVPRRIGSENAGIAPYKAFEANDGWIVIAAGNDGLFARLAVALSCPDWIADARFVTNPERVKNREALNAQVAEVVKSQSVQHWTAKLEAAGVPHAPMLTLDQVLAHPQFEAVGMLQQPPAGDMPLLGLPIQFDGERPPYRSLPPVLGEANATMMPLSEAKA